jgi:hypothetical protein
MSKEIPFKGILGHSKELEVIEFLIAEPYGYYDISELADIVEMNRNTISRIIKKFASIKLLEFTSGKGRSKCFRLNGNSKIVKSIDVLSAGILDETGQDLSLFETTIKAFLPRVVETISSVESCESKPEAELNKYLSTGSSTEGPELLIKPGLTTNSS